MAIKRYYVPLTNCIVIKVVILCDDDDVAWILPPSPLFSGLALASSPFLPGEREPPWITY
jgi:hypothetical protein